MEKVSRSVASFVYFKLRVVKYSLVNGFRTHLGRRLRYGRSGFGVLVCSLKVEKET